MPTLQSDFTAFIGNFQFTYAFSESFDCFLKIYNEGFSGLAFHKLEELNLIN